MLATLNQIAAHKRQREWEHKKGTTYRETITQTPYKDENGEDKMLTTYTIQYFGWLNEKYELLGEGVSSVSKDLAKRIASREAIQNLKKLGLFKPPSAFI